MIPLARFAMVRSKRPSSGGAAGYSALTFRGSDTSASNTSTYTFSSKNLGSALSTNFVIVALVYTLNGGGQPNINTVTVGGVTATEIVTAKPFFYGLGLFIANVPAGGTGSIVIGLNGNADNCHIGWWTVQMNSETAHASTSGGSLASSQNLNTDIPANGFAVHMGCCITASDQSHSIDQSFVEQAEAFNEFNSAYSHKEVTAAETPNVSSTWSGTPDSVAAVYASWNGNGT